MVGLLPHSGARGEGRDPLHPLPSPFTPFPPPSPPFPLSQASLPACLPQVTGRSFQVHIIISNIRYLGSFPTPEYTAIPRTPHQKSLGITYLLSPYHTGPLELVNSTAMATVLLT